ncbi:MAG TPA: site-specific integrase, partial [Anaerolineales bacterium]|nr:site-specific integrase [Anaerolineales bacterium]
MSDEKQKSYELIELLERAEFEDEAIRGARMRRWAEAFEAWLEERRSRFSRNVGEDSFTAWREFLAYLRKPPWEARAEDVEAYVATLQERGASTGTIQKRLTGLAKFYAYCQKEGIDPECGEGFNPAAKARRPSIQRY